MHSSEFNDANQGWLGRIWRLTSFVLLPFFLAFAVAVAVTAYIETRSGLTGSASTEAQTLSPLAQLMNLSPLANRAAPGFALTNQNGRVVSLANFRGKVVVLAFIDSRCTEVCPVVAQEIIGADHQLGASARNVAFVGVNVNPLAESVVDVRRFSDEHGLSALPNWYYLTGSTTVLSQVWKNYGIQVELPRNATQTVHADYLYFLSPLGRERFLAEPIVNQRRNGVGYLPADLVRRWSKGIAHYVELSMNVN